MARKRQSNGNFTIIENEVLRSAKLSPKARLVYAVLKSHVDAKTNSWRISVALIAEESGYCRRSVFNALRELRDAGLVRSTRNRKGSGQGASTYTIVGASAIVGDKCSCGDGAQDLQPDGAVVCRQCTQQGADVAGDIYKNQNLQDSTPPAPCEGDVCLEGEGATDYTGADSRSQVDLWFDMFWESYPKHVQKKKAQAAFRRLFSHVEGERAQGEVLQNIGQRLARYVEDTAGRDARYIMAPASWLRSYDFTQAPEADELLMREVYV